MKLDEIVVASFAASNVGDADWARDEPELRDAPDVLTLSSSLSIGEQDRTFVFKQNGEPVGRLALGHDVVLFDETYSTIKDIYLVPRLRKTRAGGAFLVGVKNLLKGRSLILGDEEARGGVIFKDGMSLVKALNASSRQDVHLLNLKTGEKTELGDEIPVRPAHMTLALIFESTFPFPIVQYKGSMSYVFEGVETTPFSIDGEI